MVAAVGLFAAGVWRFDAQWRRLGCLCAYLEGMVVLEVTLVMAYAHTAYRWRS